MRAFTFRRTRGNEEGFVLVLALVLLLLLTLFGVWALNSSDFENRVASNAQQAERQFNLAEAANYTEAALVGYGQREAYKLKDMDRHNRVLVPEGDEFDPINANPKHDAASVDRSKPATWPWGNLEGKTKKDADRNSQLDYRYLVTYLYPDTPPKGYAADQFDSYKFRIQGNAARRGLLGAATPGRIVETAGGKVRNRSTL